MGAVRELRPKVAAIPGNRGLILQAHDRVGVVGKSGSGKSRWVKEQCARWMRAGLAVAAFDPMDEMSAAGHQLPGRFLGPLATRKTVAEILADPLILERCTALAIVPEGSNREIADQLGDVAELIELVGQLVFVLEEVGLYAQYARETLEHIFCRFRHAGVPCVAVSQRAVMLPASCRAQLSHLISFSQNRAADLSAIAADFSEDFAARVSRLKRGEHEHWREED
jgi:hypothetical protein